MDFCLNLLKNIFLTIANYHKNNFVKNMDGTEIKANLSNKPMMKKISKILKIKCKDFYKLELHLEDQSLTMDQQIFSIIVLSTSKDYLLTSR